jgi:flagellar biosynthesis chaperone FliJ
MKYALEPVRQQREWTLDAARARLAASLSELAGCEARVLRLAGHRDNEARATSDAWQRVRDPRSQRAALAYLSFLQQQVEQASRELALLRDRVSDERAACESRQRKLEVIEEHRRESLREARFESNRKSAAQSDADWTARSHLGEGDTQ